MMYALDKYLGCMLDRSCALSDDECDQEYPMLVNDEYLFADHVMEHPSDPQYPSLMIASVAHAKLMRICGRILKDLYSIKKVSDQTMLERATLLMADLNTWEKEVPGFLIHPLPDAPFLKPIYQRQSTVLQLAFAHAKLLTMRPFLPALKKLSANRQICLIAALKIVDITTNLTERHQYSHAYWFEAYLDFSAMVILYTFLIYFPDDIESYDSSMRAGKCLDRIRKYAESNSLGQRYVAVIEELQIEVELLRTYQPKGRNNSSMGIAEMLNPEMNNLDFEEMLMSCFSHQLNPYMVRY